jgi:hypothetical protein
LGLDDEVVDRLGLHGLPESIVDPPAHEDEVLTGLRIFDGDRFVARLVDPSPLLGSQSGDGHE